MKCLDEKTFVDVGYENKVFLKSLNDDVLRLQRIIS
jgi:hypothetical protein